MAIRRFGLGKTAWIDGRHSGAQRARPVAFYMDRARAAQLQLYVQYVQNFSNTSSVCVQYCMI